MTGFLVIGDATLDVIVGPSGPMQHGGDVPARISVGSGGQGANVAVRLARRGAAVTLASAIGPDAAGRLLGEGLAAEGVTHVPLVAARSGTVVVLLDEAGERSMFSDRVPLAADQLTDAIRGAAWIHASGYPLVHAAEGDSVAAALAGRPHGTRLSIAGGSIPPDPALAAAFGGRVATARPDVVVLGLGEASALLGSAQPGSGPAAVALATLASVVVVTGGAAGSAGMLGGDLVAVPAPESPTASRDATGAGDAFLAALILDLWEKEWPPTVAQLRVAMERGTEAGRRVAVQPGAQAPIAGERAGVARP